MNTILTIAEQVAAGIKCDASGSCVVFANELCQRAGSHDFKVIEGSVKFKGSIPQKHVWIESNTGIVIDPTLAQFNFFSLETVVYTPVNTYKPATFARQIKRHPEFRRFHELKKTLKRA